MHSEPFTTAPFVVGKSTPSATDAHIPARRDALPDRFARLDQQRIQAPCRRGLAQGAGGQAWAILQPALPVSPTWASCGCAARRASIASIAPTGRDRIPLQMRRPRHARARDLASRRSAQHRRTARCRLHAEAGMEEHRGARPRRRPRHLGADLAARRRKRRRRHRDPERAQRRIRHGAPICSRRSDR